MLTGSNDCVARTFLSANLKGGMFNLQKFGTHAYAGLLAILCLLLSSAAYAHNGPPFPIVEKRHVGPFVIDLWTHPDLGYGTFFVIVDPAPGATIPSDLKVQVSVQPETGRLPEKTYDMWRDSVRDHVQFDNNRVEFDQQEFWRVRLVLQSSAGGGEVLSRVEPTPTGLGKWDLLFYALPFLFVAFMWYRGISRRKKQIRRNAARTPTVSPKVAAVPPPNGQTVAGPAQGETAHR